MVYFESKRLSIEKLRISVDSLREAFKNNSNYYIIINYEEDKTKPYAIIGMIGGSFKRRNTIRLVIGRKWRNLFLSEEIISPERPKHHRGKNIGSGEYNILSIKPSESEISYNSKSMRDALIERCDML